MVAAALVLAGGRSTRMGRPKADLEWHGSTLLRQVTGIAARGAGGAVVVVRAPGQLLPALAPEVQVVDDPTEGRGPLQGLATGLAALRGHADVAFACATDLPFLHPAYVRAVLAAIGDAHAVVPHVHGHRQTLAAAYRTDLAPLAQARVDGRQLRLAGLLDGLDVVEPDEDTLLADSELAEHDPLLRSVEGCNDSASYRAARAQPPPEVVVVGHGRQRAATLGALLAGLPPESPVGSCRLNGHGLIADPAIALCAGDVVQLDPHAPLDEG